MFWKSLAMRAMFPSTAKNRGKLPDIPRACFVQLSCLHSYFGDCTCLKAVLLAILGGGRREVEECLAHIHVVRSACATAMLHLFIVIAPCSMQQALMHFTFKACHLQQ